MNIQQVKKKRRIRRKNHIRKKIKGTEQRPRLTVYKSLNNIYAQLIDDVSGNTLVSASTIDKEVKTMIKKGMGKVEQSKLVGTIIGKRAIENNIKTVSFDRNGFLYHGRIKTLADEARKSGLEF